MAPTTIEAIWQAADELEAEGIRPTLTAVRNRVGGGSFTTITTAMGQWRKRRQQEALGPTEPLPDEIGQHVDEIGQRLSDIGQQLRVFGSEVWTKARVLADEQMIGLRQRLEAEKNEISAQMVEAVELADQLTEEVKDLRQQLAEREALQAEHETLKAQMAEMERRYSDELARARDQAARHEAAAGDARTNEKAALERAARAEDRVETLNDQLAEATGKLQRLEAEQASTRTQMTEAVQLADRLAAEAEVLRRQVADHQALQAEHEVLKAHLAEVERRHAEELAQAAERTTRQETVAADALAAEKAALERAARAEGQVDALKNQLAEVTATLRPGAKGSPRGSQGVGGKGSA
jgi:DNA repair exonuclease SbcCD ATPase subunit